MGGKGNLGKLKFKYENALIQYLFLLSSLPHFPLGRQRTLQKQDKNLQGTLLWVIIYSVIISNYFRSVSFCFVELTLKSAEIED